MARLDVRLDAEGRRRLDVLVEDTGEPASEIVRRLIDDAYGGVYAENAAYRLWSD